MHPSFITGIVVGTTVSFIYNLYKKRLTKTYFIIETLLIIFLILIGLLYPDKGNAWCDNCKTIPPHLFCNYVKNCEFRQAEAERIRAEVKLLADQYAFNGNDLFMTSIAAGMSSLPSGELTTIAVSVILANTAVYFCKTVECHWKTVHLLNELEFHLYFYKQSSEEILHNRYLCPDCHEIFFHINYLGYSKLYFNQYPPCAFEEDGCLLETE